MIIFIIISITSYFGSKKVELVYDVTPFLPNNLESIETLETLRDVYGERDSFYLISKKGNEDFLNTIKKGRTFMKQGQMESLIRNF